MKSVDVHFLLSWLSVIVAIALVVSAFFFSAPHAASQTSSAPITGYAWSDTIGWVSFDGSNYGMTIEEGGTITGYAWSDNIGWISAEAADITGCPSSPCTPTLSGEDLTGWLKALSASGTWDGWISLSGASYGVSLGVDGSFTGYAWGDTNVGWLDFSYASTVFQQCTPTYFCTENDRYYRNGLCVESLEEACEWGCSGGGCLLAPAPEPNGGAGGAGSLRIAPSIVPQGNTTRVLWDILYADSCTVSAPNGDSWSATASPQSGYQTSVITQATTYTLECTGEGGSFSESVSVRVIPIFREI